MHLKYIFLINILLFGSAFVKAQSNAPLTENDKAIQEQRRQEELQNRATMSRQELMKRERNVQLVRQKNGVVPRYKPELTKRDIAAVSINPLDTQLFADFLRQPNTGIVRLQNADICPTESFVVQAEGNCPNNIVGKATAYSFRESDYTTKILADLFFAGNRFSSTGVFTIGIFASLGNAEIKNLNGASDGIKQLIEFQPAEEKTEVLKQHQRLVKGVQVGNYVYKGSVEAKENTSYVLRTIAYKGKIFKGSGVNRVNLLENDKRKDVTLIFKLIRKHEDGSVTLLWKALQEKPSPKIVFEESEKEKKQPGNPLTGSA